MQKVHEFKKSLVVGEKGESIIMEHLYQNKNVERVIDVRNDKHYQNEDVDLVVKMITGHEMKIEIKTDTYQSGNIYYETVSAEETNSIGGFEKSTADYLFYYFINLESLYIMDMKEYRKWFATKKDLFDSLGYQKRPVNRRWNGSTYTSVGYAYPVSILEDLSPRWMRKIHLDKI